MKIRNYQDLTVWQKSMDLAEEIYIASRAFPKSETYGLSSQVRRAAVSIASNVAEGAGQEINRRLSTLSSQVGRMIHGMRKSLENHKRKTLTPDP